MTVSTYTTNLTDLYAGAGSTTNWSALGGGGAGLNAETDYFIQGTGMTSKNAFAGAKKGMIFDSGADRASTIGTDGAALIWVTHATPNSLALQSAGGIDFLVGSASSDYKHWYVGGSDSIEFMGWVIAAVNPSETTDEADTGTPSAVEQFFGILFDLPVNGPTKGAPNAVDAIRVGRCDLIYEFGTVADPDATFDLAVADKGDVTDRLGLIQERSGSLFLSGLHQFGSATNVVNFTDINKTLFWNDHPAVTALFNTVDIQNASSTVDMTSISWKALGTKSPGTWTTTDNATVNLTACSFIDWGDFTFLSNTTVDRCTFLSCGLITLGEANISGSSITTPTVSADEGAVFDDRTTTAATILSEYDGCAFSKGSLAHHAIRFGINVNDNITITGCDFSGFSSVADSSDATFRFDATSGTLNLNLINCTVDGGAATVGNIGIDDAAGISVTVVISPVTTDITVTDNDGVALQSARVLVEAEDGVGDLPFDDTVTITRSGSVATVSHIAHGLILGDKIVIRDSVQDEYNGVFDVSNITTNTYDYTVSGTPTTPATGTIKATGAVIFGLTDVAGVLTSSRSWGADQNVKGFVRKSTAAPYFKSFNLSGNTINSSVGLSINVRMVLDQ